MGYSPGVNIQVVNVRGVNVRQPIKEEFLNSIRENILLKLEEKIHSCDQHAFHKVVAEENQDIVKLQYDVEMLQQRVKTLKDQN